mmetsp:Transcript_23687/g.51804  ORF Transcript_23687/g.51804 Transcript_23687/m.51804 type:complete len:102 (+) Transcript_23687:234-539(+)
MAFVFFRGSSNRNAGGAAGDFLFVLIGARQRDPRPPNNTGSPCPAGTDPSALAATAQSCGVSYLAATPNVLSIESVNTIIVAGVTSLCINDKIKWSLFISV